MKTEIINIKTDPLTKKKAHRLASNLGFSLSTLINAYLKQLIKDETVHFSNRPAEVPSKWLEKSLAYAATDEKEGYVSPTFDNVEDSVKWLLDPKAKYINGKSK